MVDYMNKETIQVKEAPQTESASERAEQSMYEICLLHSRADRALRMVVSRRLDQFKVTMMEWLLLGVVESGAKDGMTMSTVANALDVTLPQVTALTASLTKLKLIKQKISRQDRRSRRLAVTTSGKKMLTDIEQEVDQAMQQWVVDIPPSDFSTYMRTVQRLATRKPNEVLQ
jgi:DNA-binding MarR family transcriptional regulator